MQPATLRSSANVSLRYVAWWAALSLLFELAWESAHVRLYTIWADPDRWYVAWSVLHCTLGDLVIGGAAYGLAACLLRHIDWPISQPWRGAGIIIVLTTLYTVWSEWNNVYRVRSWAYVSQVPTVFGIGLSPLLQWVLLPPLIVVMMRALHLSDADQT